MENNRGHELFLNFGPLHIFETGEVMQFKFYTQIHCPALAFQTKINP